MGSWAFHSEEALAALVSERMGARASTVLIGGLGMGVTLAAARSAFSQATTFLVAELVPQVAACAEGPLAPIMGAGAR